MSSRVVIVGAGMAGLTAARRLTTRHEVVVLDKARGVGGRMATRRIGEATLDHGAQFLTAHSDEFAGTLAALEREGAVAPWFHALVGPQGVGESDGHTRYRGVPAMNGIAKHLAAGLDVRSDTRVIAVEPDGDGWRLQTDAGDYEADAVVLTAPVPQSLEMLDAGGTVLPESDQSALRSISYDPCIAVLAPLAGPSGLPDPGAVDPADGPIDWMADNRAKGISGVPAVTIHATPEASRDLWESPDDVVRDALLGAAALDSEALDGQVHIQRWRYSRPVVLHPDRCMLAACRTPLAFAGDAFGGAKVEGAALSGEAAARCLSESLGEGP